MLFFFNTGVIPAWFVCNNNLIAITISTCFSLSTFIHFTALKLDQKYPSSCKNDTISKAKKFVFCWAWVWASNIFAVTADERQIVEPKRDGLLVCFKKIWKVFFI